MADHFYRTQIYSQVSTLPDSALSGWQHQVEVKTASVHTCVMFLTLRITHAAPS